MVDEPSPVTNEQRREEPERETFERHEVERTYLESKSRLGRLLNTIPCALYDYALWPDGRSSFIYISPKCEEIFELDAVTIRSDAAVLWGMVHPDDRERLQREDFEANRAKRKFKTEVRIITPSGKNKWIQLTSMPSEELCDSQVIWSGVILDITENKQLEVERDRTLLQLQQALAQVKTLRGYLPICCSCKKIRDDKGYWSQIELYISQHSEIEFSHGICPDCVEKLYPGIDITES